jgi:hypothetical protein
MGKSEKETLQTGLLLFTKTGAGSPRTEPNPPTQEPEHACMGCTATVTWENA